MLKEICEDNGSFKLCPIELLLHMGLLTLLVLDMHQICLLPGDRICFRLKSQAERYCSLICCEMKTLYHG